jgi:hypothetical protein
VTSTAERNNRHFWLCGAKNDPFFLFLGAEAIKRDNPNAETHFCHTGHFALETHTMEIAGAIQDFLSRKLGRQASAKSRRTSHDPGGDSG